MAKRFEICSRISSCRVLIAVLTKILLNLTVTEQRFTGSCAGGLEPFIAQICACSLLSASSLPPALLKKNIFQCETYLAIFERRCESGGIINKPYSEFVDAKKQFRRCVGKVSISHTFSTGLPISFPALEAALDNGMSLKVGCGTQTLGSAAPELFW